ncbi:MAG TPA: glycosyltransferase [Fibrobacteria bacterium]|nr:glycosyltransferase [Fibrobacteria bacterium]
MRLIVISPYPLKSGIVSAYLKGYAEQYRERGFEVVLEKMYFWEGKLRYSLKWLALLRYLVAKDTRILLAQHTPPASGPLAVPFLLLARALGKGAVVVAHETPDTYAKHLPPALRPLYHAYEAALVRLARHYVVHTRLHQEALQAFTKVPVQVVPHPVPKVERREATPGSPKVWGFYGMVAKKKGVDLLLKAYCSLPAGSVPYLRIMGAAAPGEEAHLEGLKASVPASHRHLVAFTGYVKEEDKPRLFSDVSLMVFPYRWISQSGALAETCMFRIPYLASDVAYFKDFHATFDCGRLFKSEDVASLAEALAALAKVPLVPPESSFADMERRLAFKTCADRMEELLRD